MAGKIKQFFVENFAGLMGKNSVTQKEVEETNYKFKIFQDLESDIKTDDFSSIKKYFGTDEYGVGGAGGVAFGAENMYFTISTDKIKRLKQYLNMAAFPEVGDAIEEICDNSISYDENGYVLKVKFRNTDKFNTIQQEEILRAANEYLNLFDFETHMFEYMKELIIKGEITWENLVSKDHTEEGILDIKYIESECYDFVYDTRNNERKGIGVTCNPDLLPELNQSVGGASNISIEHLNMARQIQDKKVLFLPWNQVTYVNTGLYSFDKTFVYPILERARKPYNQLSLLEDAIIIYRLVRAPERLLFSIDTGNASRTKAEQEVMKLMRRYNTKKIYDTSTGTVANGYNVHSMLENFWFTKPAGSNGSDVKSIGGGTATLGDLPDLQYFLRKLYVSLKVPFNKMAETSISINADSGLTYEEYRFAKFIIRLHTCFSQGLSKGLKTHLQLKGLWDEYKIQERDISIVFTPPSNFERYEQQQRLANQINMYTKLADRTEFSKTLAMKRYLNYTEQDIQDNWKALEEETIKQAMIQNKAQEIGKSGDPNPFGNPEEDIYNINKGN